MSRTELRAVGDMKRKKDSRARRKKDDVVLLADLAPRADVKGGAGRLFFGERVTDTGRGGDADVQEDEVEDDAEGEGPGPEGRRDEGGQGRRDRPV
jgi:hypothetical protein